MLTLIEGGFFSDRELLIKEAIREKVLKEERSYLIVPEQQTVLAERQMTDFLPGNAPLYFEATNFTRFADTVLRSIGGLCGKCADAPERALVMWLTLSELAPFLDITSKAEVNSGTVEKALSALAQMQRMGIDAQKLTDAKKEIEALSPIGNDRLKSKLSDLSAISALYQKLLTERFSGSPDTISLLAQMISPSVKLLESTAIYIDGFTSFTEAQYSVIEKLASFTDVTVSLVIKKGAQDAFEFTEAAKAHERLVKIGAKADCDVKIKRAEEIPDERTLFNELCYSLWHGNMKLGVDTRIDSGLRVFEAATPYDECDFLASDIKRKVMAGASYSDFAIIARSASTYAGIIDNAFEKAGIPLFVSKRKDISSTEGVKLIYTAISAVIGGFKSGDVIAYSKCSLSGIDRDLADELELYVNTWQISGRRFTEDTVWNMNPRGYSDKRKKSDDEKLLRINEARKAVIEPLCALKSELDNCKTVSDFCRALLAFLLSLNTERNLSNKSDELMALGLDEHSRDTALLWKGICRALDILNDTLGDISVNQKTFLTLLQTVFSYADIGRIPSYTDQITLTSADTGRIDRKKHVYIIGVNYGSFPQSVFDDEYFSEKDGELLDGVGMPDVCERAVRSARELYYVMRAIAATEEELTVSYPAASASFDGLRPSDVVTRISEITRGRIVPKKLSELAPEDRIYTSDYAVEHSYTGALYGSVKEALMRVGYEDRIRLHESNVKNENARLGNAVLSALYKGPLALSQSKIDKFVDCPMSYFCKYNLGLNEPAIAEFGASDIGTFIHAVLENFFKELSVRKLNIGAITEEEKLDLVNRAAKCYADKIFSGIPQSSARMQVNTARLAKAAMPAINSLCAEFSGCKYEPLFFELEIDRGVSDKPEAVSYRSSDGREVYVVGKIDRLDRYKGEDGSVYVRVVDYKTGSKAFKPEDLEEGKNLQMFLYLKSVSETKNEKFKKSLGAEDGAKVIPAGVIYMKTDISDGKIDRKDAEKALADAEGRQERFGMLLDDETNLAAMHPDTLPIKVTKKGEVKKDPDSFYSEDGWNDISETLRKTVTDIADKILGGEISATPLKKGGKAEVCKYCDFKTFCRNAKV